MASDQNALPSLLPSLTELQALAASCGLAAIGVADLNLLAMQPGMSTWLAAGYHGEMDYLARNLALRDNPAELLPGAQSAIVIRMDYLPQGMLSDAAADRHSREGGRQSSESDRHSSESNRHPRESNRHPREGGDPGETITWQSALWQHLDSPTMPYISVYARGRDYHKVLKSRLKKLIKLLENKIGSSFGPSDHRICCDSAPVYEVELGRKAGLGWRGKHTLLLNREAGSFFFLAEILTTLPVNKQANIESSRTDPAATLLPTENAPFALIKTSNDHQGANDTNAGHCGSCTRCIDICPTQAIIAPYHLDARRCISYLTIEFDGVIPEHFREAIGNRIYGCDDCQLICPWNKFAQHSAEADFQVKTQWQTSADGEQLIAWLGWDEALFLKNTEGTAIRRIGHQRWQRNLAIAIGNALRSLATNDARRGALREKLREALQAARQQASPMVIEHIDWALKEPLIKSTADLDGQST